MTHQLLFTNTAITAREKVKFDETVARRMISAATAEDAAKVLLPLGYDIEHPEHIVAKKLAETLDTFDELCPDKELKKFVRAASNKSHTTPASQAPLFLKGEFSTLRMHRETLQYIENYFGKGVTGLPEIKSSTAFDLENFLNWFIMKLEELRIVKAILLGKKLGIPNTQLRTMIRGGK